MRLTPTPTKETLDSLLMYTPETGKLHWKERPVSMFTDGKQTAVHNAAIWNGKNAGNEAFKTPFASGHLTAAIFGKTFLAHRIVWKMAYGSDPNVIDHIDGNPTNNRLENLRSVTQTDNTRNARLSKSSTSGHTGVSFDKRRNKWEAKIMVDRKKRFLGYFDTIEEAAKARKEADAEYGFHQNHGRPLRPASPTTAIGE